MSNTKLNYEDVFHAILAMDVYHRGVNSGLKDLTLEGITRVGTANL